MMTVGRYSESAFCLGIYAVKPHETDDTVLPAEDAIFSHLFRNAWATVSPADEFIGFLDPFEQMFIIQLPRPFGTPFPCVIPAP